MNKELDTLAREAIESHHPTHREYKVADGYLKAQSEIEQLRGIKPELPPRPDGYGDDRCQHPGLPRYGLRWNGPTDPMAVPMVTGYWTPFHMAMAEIERLRGGFYPVIDTCGYGHKYAKLPDHPMRDGEPRCPQCMAIGLDAERAENAKLRGGAVPVAEVAESDSRRIICWLESSKSLRHGDKLYTAPPASAVPDAMPLPSESTGDVGSDLQALGEAIGWNKCRAAMLSVMKRAAMLAAAPEVPRG